MTTAKTFSQQALSCRVALLEHVSQEASHLLEMMAPASEQQEQERVYLQAWLAGVAQEWDRLIEGVKPLLIRYPIMKSEEVADFGEGQVVAVRCWFRLGQIALALGLPMDAQTHLEKCLALLHQRRLAEHDVRAEAAVLQAKATLQGGSPLRAIGRFQQAFEVCHHYEQTSFLPALYEGLCESYQRTGQLHAAITTAENGIRWLSETGGKVTADHYWALGRLYWRSGCAQEATTAYWKALAQLEARSPRMSVIYAALIINSLQAGDLREIEDLARKADQSLVWTEDPRTHAWVESALGWFESEQAAREQREEAALERRKKAFARHEKAIDLLQRSQIHIELSEYYMRASQVLEDMGQMKEAHAYAKQAASLLIEK